MIMIGAKASVDITLCVGEEGGGCALQNSHLEQSTTKPDTSNTYPITGVDCSPSIADSSWNTSAVARPEPDLDEGCGSLHGIPTTSVGVEGWSVAISCWCQDTTTGISA